MNLSADSPNIASHDQQDPDKLLYPSRSADHTITLFVPQSSFVTTMNNRFRNSMEDTCTIVNNFMVSNNSPSRMDTPFTSYYSVFDGHSGDYAAKWCAEHLYKTIAKHLDLFTPHWSFPEIIASAFDEADRQITSNNPDEKSGCTASVAIVSLSAILPQTKSCQQNPQKTSNSSAIDKLNPDSFAFETSSSSSSTDSFESSGSYFSSLVNNQPHTPTTKRKTRRSYSTISPTLPSLSSSLSSFSSPLSSSPFLSLNSSLLSRKQASGSSPQTSGTHSPASHPRFNKYLYTCNVGDSRIVISSNGKARDLSNTHNPKDPDEEARINALPNSFVSRDRYGLPRVNGVLAVSRALGDKPLKPAVSARPFVTETLLDPEADELVIIASDGLWDVCSSQTAVDLVRYIDDPEEASSVLVRYALNNKSEDNITALVVRLKKAPLKTHAVVAQKASHTSPLYHTYSTDTVSFDKLPTSTISKHANTAPRPVNSNSSRPITPSTSTSNFTTTANTSNASCSMVCSVGAHSRKSSSGVSSRSDSDSSSNTVMVTSTSPPGSSIGPMLSSASSAASTISKIPTSARPIRNSSSRMRPNIIVEGALSIFPHLGLPTDVNNPGCGAFSPRLDNAKFDRARLVQNQDEELGENSSNAIDDDDDDDIIMDTSNDDDSIEDEEEDLFEADDIIGTNATSSSNFSSTSEPMDLTSSIDTITDLRPVMPSASSSASRRRRTSFFDSDAPRLSRSPLKSNNSSISSSPSSYSGPTRAIKTRVGILEIPIGSPNKLSPSLSCSANSSLIPTPASSSSSSPNKSSLNPKGFQNIMSNMPGGTSPNMLSPRAVYREKLRSQSFSSNSSSVDSPKLSALLQFGKYGTANSKKDNGLESNSNRNSLHDIQEGAVPLYNTSSTNQFDGLSSGFSPSKLAMPSSFYYTKDTTKNSATSINSSSDDIIGGSNLGSETGTESNNNGSVYSSSSNSMKFMYDQNKGNQYLGQHGEAMFVNHLGLEETASTSISSSTGRGSMGTLDRYGRFKPVIDVEFGDLDDAECAIVDDDDDD